MSAPNRPQHCLAAFYRDNSNTVPIASQIRGGTPKRFRYAGGTVSAGQRAQSAQHFWSAESLGYGV